MLSNLRNGHVQSVIVTLRQLNEFPGLDILGQQMDRASWKAPV